MLEAVYNKIKKYGDVSKDEVSIFFNSMTLKEFQEGDHFYTPNDNSSLVGMQISGLLRIYMITENGEERITDFCRPGDIISTMDGEEPSKVFIEAIDKTTIAYIDNNYLESLIENDPKWQKIFRKMLESCLSLKYKREIELLSLDSKGRYKKFLEDFKDVKDRIPQFYIASYLGITPVSLSRLKKDV